LIRQIRLLSKGRKEERKEGEDGEKPDEQSLTGIGVVGRGGCLGRNGRKDDKNVWIQRSKRCVSVERKNMVVIVKYASLSRNWEKEACTGFYIGKPRDELNGDKVGVWRLKGLRRNNI
jgi:hypothetical protein